MKKIMRIGIALFAAMVVLALAGCPQEAGETVFSNDAGLLRISVNGQALATLPQAVSKDDWDAPAFNFGAMPNSLFVIADQSSLSAVAVSATPKQAGAKIQYARGTDSSGPAVWSNAGTFSDLSKTDVLYITVRSESGKVRNFYKVRLAILSDGQIATLSYFAVNRSDVAIVPKDNPADVAPGTMWVDSAESAQAQVSATPTDTNATVTTALVKRGNDYQNAMFYDTTTYEVDDGDVLWVKCVSFDESVTLYYAATIRIYNHITLTIRDKPVELIGRGGPANNTANFGSIVLTSAEAAVGALIKATPIADVGATVIGYQTNTGTTTETNFTIAADGSYTTTAAIPASAVSGTTTYLVIKIEDKFGQIYYYRVYLEVWSNSAVLSAITVGGVSATLGTPQSAPWTGTDNTGAVIVPPGAATPNDTGIMVTSTSGAVGSWTKAADATATPIDGSFSSNPIAGGVAAGNYIFIKAISKDGSATQYYKILVSDVKNNDVSLTSVTINTATASSIGSGGSAVNVGTGTGMRGAISISPTVAAQTGLKIKATPTVTSGAAVTGYAVVASTNNSPTFNAPDADGEFTTTAAITNGQHLFVRVVAENGSLYYYRIVITVLSDNANLTAITVGGITATLGTPQSAPWAGTDNTGTVTAIPTREASPNATSVAVTSSASASVTWAKAANATATPAAGDYITGSVPGGLAAGNYLFVKAVSSDSTTTQYYKIQIVAVKSDDFTLASVNIGGVSINAGGVGAGGTAVNVGTNYRGAITLTTAQAALGTVIKATPFAGSNAAITGYAIVASTNNSPTFESPDANGEFTTTAAITNGQHLFVRVETEIGSLYYYRIAVTVQSNVATLTAVTAGGIAASSLGTPQNAPWAGTDNTGTVTVPPSGAAPNGTSMATTPTQTNAVRTWAVAANASAVPADSAFNATTPIAGGVAAGNYIFVKSVSQDGSATLYYKLLVDVKNNVATLASASIDGTAVAALPTPNAAWANAAATLTRYTSAPTTVTLSATVTASSNATVTYAASSGGTEPLTGDWASTLSLTSPVSGAYIAARVIAENGTTTNYYRWRIVYGSEETGISGITISGGSGTTGTGGTAVNVTAANRGAITITTAQAAAGASITATPTDSNADVTGYAIVANTNNNPTFVDPDVGGGFTTTAAITNGQHLFIRVRAEDGITLYYYRVVITVE